MRIALIALLGFGTLAGCEADPDSTPAGPEESRIVADLLARVGNRSIGAMEVESRAMVDGLDARTALQNLIDEELLLQEAATLGFTEGRDAERSVERLMVRAMLHDLEKENTPETVTTEELRADYALHHEKFLIPERRRSWHILVKDDSDAGRVRAESILRELRQSPDPREVYDRYAAAEGEGSEAELSAEDLPAIVRQASIEKSYKNAIFEAKSVGPLKKAVKTSYGWHAIVVAEIKPEEQRSLEDVEEDARERLSQRNRLEKLVEIVDRLRAEGMVVYDEEVVERLLSMSGLPERAEPAE